MEKKRLSIIYGSVCVVMALIIVFLLVDYSAGKRTAGGNAAGNGKLPNATTQQGGKLFDSEKTQIVKEEVKVSTEMIEDGLRDIGKLVTQEYFFTQVESYEKTSSVGILSSKAVITYSYDGTVYAGVEFGDIDVSKDEDAKTITITIPKAQIMSIEIDNDSFQVYEEKQGLWSKIKLSDVNKSVKEFKEAAEKKATEKGVLESAADNAEVVIDRFVRSIVATDEYTIKYAHR